MLTPGSAVGPNGTPPAGSISGFAASVAPGAIAITPQPQSDLSGAISALNQAVSQISQMTSTVGGAAAAPGGPVQNAPAGNAVAAAFASKWQSMSPDQQKQFRKFLNKVSTPEGQRNWEKLVASGGGAGAGAGAGGGASAGGGAAAGPNAQAAPPFDLGNPRQTLANMMTMGMVTQNVNQAMANVQQVGQYLSQLGSATQ